MRLQWQAKNVRWNASTEVFVPFGASSNGTGDMSNTGTNEAEMRCDCPKGYSGITCNTTTSGILCGPDKHPCLNGATCLLEVNPQTQVDRSYCDCSSVASLNRAYAGRLVSTKHPSFVR
jgi:hypothetical protein